jgi:hypothetical protein
MESRQFLKFSTVSHTGASNEVRKRSLISSTASEPAFRRIDSLYCPYFNFWHSVLTSPTGQIRDKTGNHPLTSSLNWLRLDVKYQLDE